MNIVSDLITFFFYQILYMSVIASVIGIVILGIKRKVGKMLSPNANYLIWLVFIISLMIPIAIPSKISIYNLIHLENMKYSVFQDETSVITNAENYNNSKILKNYLEGIKENNTKMKRSTIRNLFAYIWFIIFIVKLVKSMMDYWKNDVVMGNEEVQDERANLILEECKKRLKIKRKIHLIKQNAIHSPAITGIFKVKILVNDSVLELEDVCLVDAFMHELSHYKRKDNVMNFIIIILKSIYYFNPLILYSFYEIRKNIEFATDEMAIHEMNKEERVSYCKLMLMVASNFELKEEIIGLSNGAKYLEERILAIGNKEYFLEKSRKIFLVTIGIILSILFILYPTSYGMFSLPRIYLKLEDGTKIVLDNTSNERNKITVDKDSKIDVFVENADSNIKIFCNKLNLNTNQLENIIVSIKENKIAYFEQGDYLYTFILNYGNKQKIEYPIEILVE